MSGVSHLGHEPSPDCTRLTSGFHARSTDETRSPASTDHRTGRHGPVRGSIRRDFTGPPGPVYHVAYIDDQANRNANELARQAADEFARDFKGGEDEVKVVGEKGVVVGLAKR
jgi:hypothetical protein